MKKLLGAVSLAIACGQVPAQVALPPPPPPPGVLARNPAELKELLERKLPPMPHEAQPERWPQPDYFAEALRLTALRPAERAATPRAGGTAPLVALPVQTQAFSFGPAFRALLGAELDLQLEERGLEAAGQTEAADAYGPFVRRFDEPVLAALLKEQPTRRFVLLHAGHDGIDRMFLTLVVRDAAGQKLAHEALALPAEPAAALVSAAAALARLLPAAGLAGRAAASPAGSGACHAEHWTLGPTAPVRDLRQQACQALLAGSLLPDFAPSWWPAGIATPARQAWLARAHARASRAPEDDTTASALRRLALGQLSLAPVHSSAAALPDDPVVSRLSRLLALPGVGQAPVQSTREARARQVAAIAAGLPPFAATLVQYRAEQFDNFGQVDLCAIERQMPGLMLRGACRDGGPAAAPARTATPFERLAYQEWRVAAHWQELQRLGSALGMQQEVQAYAAALPRDVAEHPFVQRQLRAQVRPGAQATTFDEQLAQAIRAAEGSLANLATLQRHDDGARRGSLSEGLPLPNMNIANDTRMRALHDDDLRLMGVLKFDRFEPGAPEPERRTAGERAFFLEPDRNLVRWAQMQAQMDRMQRMAQSAPPLPAAPGRAAVYRRQPFGEAMSDSWHEPEEDLAARLQAHPMHMATRVGLALARLKRGAPLPEAIALIEARPPNMRSDERIGESHAWAEPAHALFFAGEPDAARGFYERVLRIGSGSQSDLHARSRVPQIAGRLDEALEATRRRQQRYESDYARRDIAALLFMRREPEAAWAALTPRLATSQVPPLWHAVLVGHRVERADMARVDAWFAERRLENVQIDHSDVDRLYHHLLAVLDRVPGEAELERLRRRKESLNSWTEPRYAASALLVRAMLADLQHSEARDAVLKVVADDNGSRNRFLLPQFAWVAWQASEGRDPMLEEMRAVGLESDFDDLLAKSLVLALDGQPDESLRYLKAARFELAHLGLGSDQLVERPLPAPYQFALAAYVMHRRTGRDEYRQEALRFVRNFQRVQPYFGWLYAMEALWEKAPAARMAAASRARYLDPGSHFLAQARVAGLDDRRCRPHLW
jgi:tetratricopeptide (TPR) repeat protein